MSTHCLICGEQANWRPGIGEVEVDDKTWVVINIMRDPLLGEKKKMGRPIDQFWAHRDCVQAWIEGCGATPNFDYAPKRLKP